MRSIVIGFVIGVWLLQQQASLWDTQTLSCVASLILIFALVAFRVKSFIAQHCSTTFLSALKLSWFALLGLSSGFAWAAFIAHLYLAPNFPLEWEARDVTVIGVVEGLPTISTQGTRFNFQIEQVIEEHNQNPAASDQKQTADAVSTVSLPTLPLPILSSVAWYAQDGASDGFIDVKPGERWRLRLRLKRPHGNVNPDGFDYEVWLLEQGIRATATVRADAKLDETLRNRKIDDFVFGVGHCLSKLRWHLRKRMQQALPNAPYLGVLVALVIGDQHDISQADWRVFNRTGIGHLISISGLHITMIAGLFASVFGFFWRRSFHTHAQLPLLIATPKVVALMAAVVAFFYVALAGFGVPAQRTLYMLLVFAIAIWTERTASISHMLCAALFVVVLIDPWAVLWPGFWLSFAAVGILIYSTIGRIDITQQDDTALSWKQRIWHILKEASITQYAVTVGLVPLCLLLFAQVSVISPIANAVAIPLISLVVTPLALISCMLPMPLSTWVLSMAHACVSVLAQILTFLSATKLAVWTAPMPTWWMMLLASIGTLWMLAPRGWPVRFVGAFCWLPILLQPSRSPVFGDMTVTAFDVGQGGAVLIETATHRLLYDTGPGMNLEANSGTRVLLPYFQARGISALDMLLISHADNDHSGGALSVLANLPTTQLLSSLNVSHSIVQARKQDIANNTLQRCEAGQNWDWDGVHFEVLHPVPVIYSSDKWKTNALSCTIKVSTQTHSLLLAGDIEAIQEDELVNSIPQKLKTDVLLAPHHGSGTSSTGQFLAAVEPQLALFQVGYLNRYHHPKPEVWQRYLDFGVKPLRTDISGAITLQFGQNIDILEYRTEHPRYWYPQ